MHSFGRAPAKLDHFGNRTAVFALQCFKKRNTLLERGELFRIEIELLGVIGERPRDFRQLHHGRGMFGSNLRGGDIDLLQFAQQTLRLGEPGQDRFVRFRKFVGCSAGKFDQTFAAAGKFIALLDFFFFTGHKICRINLVDLMAQQIKLLLARGFGGIERRVLGCQRL